MSEVANAYPIQGLWEAKAVSGSGVSGMYECVIA